MAKHIGSELDDYPIYLDMGDGDYEKVRVSEIFAIQVAYGNPDLAIAFLRNGSKGKICSHGIEIVKLEYSFIIETVREEEVYEYKDYYTRMFEAIEWVEEQLRKRQSTI